MKRFLYFALLLISTLFIAMQNAYASDIDDILKNLESPEVDYHVDSEIKTIVVPQSEFYPAIKPDLRTRYKTQNYNNPKPAASKKTVNQQKDNTPKSISKPAQKQENKAEIKKDKKSNDNQVKTSDSKEKINKASTKALSKNETQKEKSKTSDKKQNTKISDKKSKPINVYSLFLFFKDMKVVKTWVNGINENLEFFKSFSETILVFWQQKVAEEEEEEEEDEDEEGEEGEGEDGEEEEEEKKTDFSKYASIIAKGEDLYSNRNWEELQKLVDENPDAIEAPAMQKFMLMLELNKKKPNVNQVRNYADNILKEEPNSAEANYGLAYFYYYNAKKRNTTEANKYIKIAIQGKNPLKEAVKLSNEISKGNMIKIVTIALISILILSIVAFIIIKKLKAKKKAKQGTENNQKAVTDEASVSTESSPETINTNAQQVEATVTADAIPATNNEVVEEIIEEVVEGPQSDTIITEYTSNESVDVIPNASNDNQVIVEEVIEEVEEQPEAPNEEIVEEVIEEVEEEPGEEIVEEIIEEVEEGPEEEVVEEIIEEVEEDDEDYYSDDIDSISEEALLTE